MVAPSHFRFSSDLAEDSGEDCGEYDRKDCVGDLPDNGELGVMDGLMTVACLASLGTTLAATNLDLGVDVGLLATLEDSGLE